MSVLVLVKGAGDLATGVAYRLYKCGMKVVMTEVEQPTVVRRTVSFAEAVYKDTHVVEGVRARLAINAQAAQAILERGQIPILVDPEAREALSLTPAVVVDAVMAKRNTGTKISDAALVIGLGPGFAAGQDVHAVVETNRGHYLGRVILRGEAQPNTGVPGAVGGYTKERLLRAPVDGSFESCAAIADQVKAGDVLGYVSGKPVVAQISGMLRGLIKEGIFVSQGMKIGDVDPRGAEEHCYTISDKALSVAGGVLEAMLQKIKYN